MKIRTITEKVTLRVLGACTIKGSGTVVYICAKDDRRYEVANGKARSIDLAEADRAVKLDCEPGNWPTIIEAEVSYEQAGDSQ